MQALITTLHILTCLCLIAIVLLQHGKGADIGVALGGGASNTVFGARGAGSFLTKLTTGAAIVFMVTSFTLSRLTGRGGIDDLLTAPSAQETPAEAPLGPGIPGLGFEAIEPPSQGSEAPPAPEGAPVAPSGIEGFDVIEPPAPAESGPRGG